MSGWAGTLDYSDTDRVVLRDGAVIFYRDYKIQASYIEVATDEEDASRRVVSASGGVIVDQGPDRLTGETLRFDLESGTGTLTEATAFVGDDMEFSGAEIEKLSDTTYRVTDGTFTSCTENDTPDWSFRLGSANVEVNGYARAKHARFRVKKLPIAYIPYVLWPVKEKRTSGLLVPKFGYSSIRGAEANLAYYQTFGDSADATVFADAYGREYFGAGLEFRYRPSVGTKGIFQGYAIRDPVAEDWRWKALLNHSTEDLPLGLRGVVSFTDFSDFEFFRDFEFEFNQISLRRLYSYAFLSGSWGAHSLNLLVDQRETFIRTNDVIEQRQLPELEYRLRSTKLGPLPLYFELLGSGSLFSVARTELLDEQYERLDLFPQVTLPIGSAPWLSMSVTAGERITWYGDSVDETGTEFTGESLTRTFATLGADIVGPSFSRIFDKKAGRYGKFKHLIEPRWSYRFSEKFEEFDGGRQVPLFDEVDSLRSGNIVGFALVQRLLAKPDDEEKYGGAREILSFELGQSYSLRDDQPFQLSSDGLESSQLSPLSAKLRFNPTETLNLQADARYSLLFSNLVSTSLTGGMQFGLSGVGVTWYTQFDPETGEERSNQIRLFTGLQLTKRIRLDSQINYDFARELLQQHRNILTYQSQCFSFLLEYRDLQFRGVEQQDIRFAISLKNVGTFLDLTNAKRASL